jgi:hypothetical protein
LSVVGDRSQAKGKRARSRKGVARGEVIPEGRVKKIKKARRPLLEEELGEEEIEQSEESPD